MNKYIKGIIIKIRKFRDDRDWMQFHNHKDMAISIALEASELLEHFQWKKENDISKYSEQKNEKIKEEIADIAIYLFELADNMNIDLLDAMNSKLDKNNKKYPVEKAKGTSTKYNEL